MALAGRQAGGDIRLPTALIAAVGSGSLVFHIARHALAALFDIGFIAIFVLAYHQRFQVPFSAAARRPAGEASAFALLAALFVAATNSCRCR